MFYHFVCITLLVFLSMEMAKAPTTDLWIGLHNIHDSQFYWTDGRPMRYNNWGSEVSGHCNFCMAIFSYELLAALLKQFCFTAK